MRGYLVLCPIWSPSSEVMYITHVTMEPITGLGGHRLYMQAENAEASDWLPGQVCVYCTMPLMGNILVWQSYFIPCGVLHGPFRHGADGCYDLEAH